MANSPQYVTSASGSNGTAALNQVVTAPTSATWTWAAGDVLVVTIAAVKSGGTATAWAADPSGWVTVPNSASGFTSGNGATQYFRATTTSADVGASFTFATNSSSQLSVWGVHVLRPAVGDTSVTYDQAASATINGGTNVVSMTNTYDNELLMFCSGQPSASLMNAPTGGPTWGNRYNIGTGTGQTVRSGRGDTGIQTAVGATGNISQVVSTASSCSLAGYTSVGAPPVAASDIYYVADTVSFY